MSMYKLYCGDCVEAMRGLDSDIVDLTVTSPPYDAMRSYRGYKFDFESVSQEIYRITKTGGVLVWVVGDQTINGSETGTSFKQALYFKEIGFNILDTMIYQKLNGAMGSKYTYLQEFEFMFVFSKGTPKTVNFLRDRKNSVNYSRSTPIKKSSIYGKENRRTKIQRQEFGRRKNIWSYAVGGVQEFGYHPAPFPELLARDHILSWSNPGDKVFDPMCGSGTTGKMALSYQRDFIGIDISEEYISIAQKRIDSVRNQLTLSII